MRARSIVLLLGMVCAGRARAQELTLLAEPFAVGAQLLTTSERLRVGMSATAGPLVGVTLSDADVADVRNWATAYATVALRFTPRVQLVINPIGAALVAGNDFSAVYPSSQGGIEVFRGRMRLGTAVRTIRIAGANNRGRLWTHWVPVRIGLALGR